MSQTSHDDEEDRQRRQREWHQGHDFLRNLRDSEDPAAQPRSMEYYADYFALDEEDLNQPSAFDLHPMMASSRFDIAETGDDVFGGSESRPQQPFTMSHPQRDLGSSVADRGDPVFDGSQPAPIFHLNPGTSPFRPNRPPAFPFANAHHPAHNVRGWSGGGSQAADGGIHGPSGWTQQPQQMEHRPVHRGWFQHRQQYDAAGQALIEEQRRRQQPQYPSEAPLKQGGLDEQQALHPELDQLEQQSFVTSARMWGQQQCAIPSFQFGQPAASSYYQDPAPSSFSGFQNSQLSHAGDQVCFQFADGDDVTGQEELFGEQQSQNCPSLRASRVRGRVGSGISSGLLAHAANLQQHAEQNYNPESASLAPIQDHTSTPSSFFPLQPRRHQWGLDAQHQQLPLLETLPQPQVVEILGGPRRRERNRRHSAVGQGEYEHFTHYKFVGPAAVQQGTGIGMRPSTFTSQSSTESKQSAAGTPDAPLTPHRRTSSTALTPHTKGTRGTRVGSQAGTPDTGWSRQYGGVGIVPRELNLEGGLEWTALEILTFAPNSMTLPRVITRLRGNGWRAHDMAGFANWARNMIEERGGIQSNSCIKALTMGSSKLGYQYPARSDLPEVFDMSNSNWWNTLTNFQERRRTDSIDNDPPILYLADGTLRSRWPTGDDARYVTRVMEHLLALPESDPTRRMRVSGLTTLTHRLIQQGLISVTTPSVDPNPQGTPQLFRQPLRNFDREALNRWQTDQADLLDLPAEAALVTAPANARRRSRHGGAVPADGTPSKGSSSKRRKRNVEQEAEEKDEGVDEEEVIVTPSSKKQKKRSQPRRGGDHRPPPSYKGLQDPNDSEDDGSGGFGPPVAGPETGLVQ
ncbi:hypothetical protein LTS18_012266 [Coniosporium uncinatum]|uniref:Uncharacterized protein n=1 Tax=Coniosporium uncinatum TaxID=93489 RepID=A0ACC3D965_9PEZI|nr:hypothetical protein LTS18_012266 [Coniosporium uncinatum]